MQRFSNIRLIAFDADDTLWDCQSHFERVEQRLYQLISPWTDNPARELYNTESANMPDLGYGCKAFTLSVLETALRVSGGQISPDYLEELLQLGKQLLHLPATPLPGVEQTLSALRDRIDSQQTRIVVFTKGELQDQENKLRRSGLLKYFDDVEITSDKGQPEFLALCERCGVHPSEMLMVGNSLRSDVAPALAIGASAVYIPFHVTWQLEHTEDFEHPRMLKVDMITELLNYI
jgi:putative hydrolase of the HAD superfamily